MSSAGVYDASNELETMTNKPHDVTLQRVFRTRSLLMFGLAYLVPLTIFTTYGSVSNITKGHVPLAYVFTTIAMLFTAFSYANLVSAVPKAGSAYAYATEAFGERLGFATGWTLLLDYMLLPAINYLIMGIYLHAQFPEVPSAFWILLAIGVVTFLNIIGVDVVRRASFILVIAQLIFAAVFVTAAITRENSVFTIAPFYEPGIELGLIFSGAAILCLSFLGFDAVSTLSEEASDPRRTVPRAIMLTTFVGGGIFITLSYCGALVLPNWQSIVSSDSAGLELMQPLGQIISMLFITCYLAGCVASAIASQASVSRILFAMGRESVLPKFWFGQLSERFRTPVNATLTVALLSLITLVISLDTMASLISFGALFAFSLVNLSVLKIFFKQIRTLNPTLVLRYGLCPLMGFALTLWLWFHLSATSFYVGLSWLSLGVIYSFINPRFSTAIKD